jgi:hypothetical protein
MKKVPRLCFFVLVEAVVLSKEHSDKCQCKVWLYIKSYNNVCLVIVKIELSINDFEV